MFKNITEKAQAKQTYTESTLSAISSEGLVNLWEGKLALPGQFLGSRNRAEVVPAADSCAQDSAKGFGTQLALLKGKSLRNRASVSSDPVSPALAPTAPIFPFAPWPRHPP